MLLFHFGTVKTNHLTIHLQHSVGMEVIYEIRECISVVLANNSWFTNHTYLLSSWVLPLKI